MSERGPRPNPIGEWSHRLRKDQAAAEKAYAEKQAAKAETERPTKEMLATIRANNIRPGQLRKDTAGREVQIVGLEPDGFIRFVDTALVPAEVRDRFGITQRKIVISNDWTRRAEQEKEAMVAIADLVQTTTDGKAVLERREPDIIQPLPDPPPPV